MNKHWAGYVTALNKQMIPTSPDIYQTTSSTLGVSGFLDLTPKQPQIQARYDAMSGEWEGISATNKAIGKGLFSTDAMPLTSDLNR